MSRHARAGARLASVCILVGASLLAGPARAQLRTSIYVSGLSSPVEFVQDPSDRTTQYVVEQGGRIRSIRNGVLQSANFLDISGAISSGGERGLLGLAFPPDYGTSRRFYVNFTNVSGHTVVARFRTGPGNVAEPTSRFDLLWPTGQRFIVQPFSNHNGGHLAFGPDGHLYIGMGDGGSSNDPNNHAQTLSSPLGKMLRIDVSVADSDSKGYRIPPDNPFVGTSGLWETWDIGLRNPWKFSFDDMARGGTGALLIADVGQSRFEEINYEPRNRGGKNYGWRNREGAHDNITSMTPTLLPLVDPIHEYDRTLGQSISGGYVYRGAAGPAYRGRYFFADFVQGRVWSIALTIDPVTGGAQASGRLDHTTELGGDEALGNVSAFGTDADGELYVVNYSLGRILKIVPLAPGSQLGDMPVPGEYDGDGQMDVAVYRTTTGEWFVKQGNSTRRVPWGAPSFGDVPVPADYDGDGRTDIAVYRTSTGQWFIMNSGTGTLNQLTFGSAAAGGLQDTPRTADYDGDGRADLGIYRFSTGEWFILRSSDRGVSHVHWGSPSLGDTPVPGKYDGDGHMDIAVYRTATGEWFISQPGPTRRLAWGAPSFGDMSVPADYDGDGRTDVAVYRASTGQWFILNSATGTLTQLTFGSGSAGGLRDTPITIDYDGDGRADIGIYRFSTGEWFIRRSSDGGLVYVQWGAP